MDIELKYSYPRLTDELIVKLESILFDKFGCPPLPQDYKDFLLKNNGGFVMPGYVPETNSYDLEDGKAIIFDTPLLLSEAGGEQFVSRLLSFMGVWLEDDMNRDEIESEKLPGLICVNDYVQGHLKELADKMILIACCNYTGVHDGICISLDDEDYGAVYYHYEQWDQPDRFAGTYFEDKEKQILKRYGVSHMDELDEDTAEGMRAMYELHKLPFIKIADSFTGFLDMCRIEDEN